MPLAGLASFDVNILSVCMYHQALLANPSSAAGLYVPSFSCQQAHLTHNYLPLDRPCLLQVAFPFNNAF